MKKLFKLDVHSTCTRALGRVYGQQQGAPMGSQLPGTTAEFSIIVRELRYAAKRRGLAVALFYRYVDDLALFSASSTLFTNLQPRDCYRGRATIKSTSAEREFLGVDLLHAAEGRFILVRPRVKEEWRLASFTASTKREADRPCQAELKRRTILTDELTLLTYGENAVTNPKQGKVDCITGEGTLDVVRREILHRRKTGCDE